MEVIPFAFTVNLVLVEGDCRQFVLNSTLVCPTSNVIIVDPPIQLGNNNGTQCSWL